MNLQRLFKTWIVSILLTLVFAFAEGDRSVSNIRINLPYKQMGLSQEQAAAHLISR